MRSVGVELKGHGLNLKLSKDAFLRKWDDRTDRFGLVFRDAKAALILMISKRATALQMERVGGEFYAPKFYSQLILLKLI